MDDFGWEKVVAARNLNHNRQNLEQNRQNLQQNRETQELLKQLLAQKEKEEARSKSLPDCPFCGNKIPKLSVKICGQCRQEIIWVGVVPCSPEEAEREREKQERERKEQQRRRKLYEARQQQQARERQRLAREQEEHNARHLAASKIADAVYKKERSHYFKYLPWQIGLLIFSTFGSFLLIGLIISGANRTTWWIITIFFSLCIGLVQFIAFGAHNFLNYRKARAAGQEAYDWSFDED